MNDKDQSAIDHVASISKTTNARMIIEWVINGCLYDDYTDDDGNITAIRIEKPIEPRPIKPAYIVYMSKETGNTFTRDSFSGIQNNELSDRCKWVSEWIEYDPPNKWPTPLVERIAAIDLAAAQWIVDHWDDLLDEKYTMSGRYYRNSNELNSMFYWDLSDNRWKYWFDISTQLGEQ